MRAAVVGATGPPVRVSRRAFRRGIVLEVPPAMRALLAREGHDPVYGARPLRRVLETRLVTPPAVHLAKHPQVRDTTFVATPEGPVPRA